MSSEKTEIPVEASEVSKFYNGKSVFITGAAGFVGVVLLESLLRCCPGIHKIYLLLRSKKGVRPQDRKEQIFNREIFYKLKENDPKALEKVIVVSGDVSQEKLGMCEDDWLRVTEDVSIVFHCAASISFTKPLSFTVNHNVMGTYNIIEMCRKLKKLEVIVYTSTAFSNCNQETVIEEKIYGLPFTSEEILELSRNGDEDGLNRLFSQCKPAFPNYYTFSKCVSENLIAEKAGDLPVAVIRPSIIVCCWKGVMPGYVERGSAIVNISIAYGKGFIRVLRVDNEKRLEVIPVDVVANTHIIAAYHQASERLPSPSIYNCTLDESTTFTVGELIEAGNKLLNVHPLPGSYQRPRFIICKGPIKYKFFALLEHYIPAALVDSLLFLSGRKVKCIKLCQTFDQAMETLQPFLRKNWRYRSENFESLSKKLNATDAEIFNTDLKGFCLEDLMDCIYRGAPVYRRNNKPYEANLKTTYLRYTLASFIKWSALGSFVAIIYAAVF